MGQRKTNESVQRSKVRSARMCVGGGAKFATITHPHETEDALGGGTRRDLDIGRLHKCTALRLDTTMANYSRVDMQRWRTTQELRHKDGELFESFMERLPRSIRSPSSSKQLLQHNYYTLSTNFKFFECVERKIKDQKSDKNKTESIAHKSRSMLKSGRVKLKRSKRLSSQPTNVEAKTLKTHRGQ